MEHGVMATCIAYADWLMDENFNHYQPPDNMMDPNHSVAIVGWDDAHETQAPEPGAWLAKNSWGTDWGWTGYFWISYYDKHAGKNPDMGAVTFYNVIRSTWDRAYYHDYHGWRDTLEGYDEAFNAFTAEADEIVDAVSFFSAGYDVDFVVELYDDFEAGELANLLAEEEGTLEFPGLHTIDIDEVDFTTGDDFYVYLNLSSGGIPYDRTSDVPVLLGGEGRVLVPSTAAAGQSYYRDGGEWLDFYDYDDPSGYSQTGNFCIKALAVTNP
jgi:hypothetical protein